MSDYSPWEGWTVSGWPVTTLLRGKVIADRGQLLGEAGDGQLVPRRIDPAFSAAPPADGAAPRLPRREREAAAASVDPRARSSARWRPPGHPRDARP